MSTNNNVVSVVVSDSVKAELNEKFSGMFPGLTVTVNDLNIWVSGNTKPMKDALKTAGFKWAPKRGAWYMRIDDGKKCPAESAPVAPEKSADLLEVTRLTDLYKARQITWETLTAEIKKIERANSEKMQRVYNVPDTSDMSGRVTESDYAITGTASNGVPVVVAECHHEDLTKESAGEKSPAPIQEPAPAFEPRFFLRSDVPAFPDTSVRSWYLAAFPEDEFGRSISLFVTFADIANNPGRVYELLNVDDSVIRERVFCAIANIYNVGYDAIYDAWINGTDLETELAKYLPGVIPAEYPACNISDRPEKQIAGYLPAPRPVLTDEDMVIIDAYKRAAHAFTEVVYADDLLIKFFNSWNKPINKTFIDRAKEYINNRVENIRIGFYWNHYNTSILSVEYMPKDRYTEFADHYLEIPSKTRKLTTDEKKMLTERMKKNADGHGSQVGRYEKMAEHYADYLTAKKERDEAIKKANKEFDAVKVYHDIQQDITYNYRYGCYNAIV